MKPIRVFLADDHPIYRKGLARAIEETSGLVLVGTACDGAEALAALESAKVDVVVLDVMMPKLTGLDIMSRLHENQYVLLLSGSEDQEVIYTALAQGAKGYLLKTADWDDVIDGIKKIATGDTVMSNGILGGLAASVKKHATTTSDVDTNLTARESEILTLLSQGSPPRKIAKKLTIEYATVRTHLRNIYEKLGVTSQLGAVSEALRRKIVV